MKEIKTFKELRKIEQDKWITTCALDLYIIRKKLKIIDGYVLMIGANCKTQLELFYISEKNYKEWKTYIEHYYN